jgi:hypothetical protein
MRCVLYEATTNIPYFFRTPSYCLLKIMVYGNLNDTQINKTGNLHVKVTLRRVSVTIVAVKKKIL